MRGPVLSPEQFARFSHRFEKGRQPAGRIGAWPRDCGHDRGRKRRPARYALGRSPAKPTAWKCCLPCRLPADRCRLIGSGTRTMVQSPSQSPRLASTARSRAARSARSSLAAGFAQPASTSSRARSRPSIRQFHRAVPGSRGRRTGTPLTSVQRGSLLRSNPISAARLCRPQAQRRLSPPRQIAVAGGPSMPASAKVASSLVNVSPLSGSKGPATVIGVAKARAMAKIARGEHGQPIILLGRRGCRGRRCRRG